MQLQDELAQLKDERTQKDKLINDLRMEKEKEKQERQSAEARLQRLSSKTKRDVKKDPETQGIITEYVGTVVCSLRLPSLRWPAARTARALTGPAISSVVHAHASPRRPPIGLRLPLPSTFTSAPLPTQT